MHVLQYLLLTTILLGAVSGAISGTNLEASTQDFAPTRLITQMTCSDGEHGLATRWGISDISTLGNCWMEIPEAGWNSEHCGKCLKVTDTNTQNYMYLTVVSGGSGLNIQHDMDDQTGDDTSFYKLFGWRGVKKGHGYIDYEEVDHSLCHGNQGLDGSLAPLSESTCGWVAGPPREIPTAEPKTDLDSTYHPPYSSKDLATSTLACSDGTHGFGPIWGYDTIEPMHPCVAAYDLVEWSADYDDYMCGKCFKVTAKNTGNTAFINIIDRKADPGLDFNQEIMRNLFGADEHGNWIESPSQGALADAEEVDPSNCHGNKGPYGTLSPKHDPTCGIVYAETVSGCTDSNAENYNQNANSDDGSCTYVEGCTDANANNYNENAGKDDGSCTYTTGCTDEVADNYNSEAGQDDGSCVYSGGCTDPEANNYNENAQSDDGSCTYGTSAEDVWTGKQIFPATEPIDSFTCSNGANGLQTRWGINDISTLGNCWVEIPTAGWNSEDCGKCFKVIDRNTKNYIYLTAISGGGSVNIQYDESDSENSFQKLFGYAGIQAGNGQVDYHEVSHDKCHGNQGLTGELTALSDSTCGWTAPDPVLGCTDSDAENYDESATQDDGSCVIRGCTDSEADNYNNKANVDDGSCQTGGCTDSNANNYNAQANTDDGSCTYGTDDGTKRCGATWAIAQQSCAQTSCPNGDECPSGEYCFGSLEQCVNGSKFDTGTKRCGFDWSDANDCSKDEIITCPNGNLDGTECPSGQSCVAWLAACPASRRKL